MKTLHLLQAEYWNMARSIESARMLVVRKCRNMKYLIATYTPYQKRQYPERMTFFRQCTNRIHNTLYSIDKVKTRQSLFLAEARATRAYWDAVALLMHCPEPWKRVYPYARDPWNRALNIGYTMLAHSIRTCIQKHNLIPTIGIFHSPQDGQEALVYDLQELFRQPCVDAAIIPLFSRKKRRVLVASKDIATAYTKRMEERMHYRGSQWHLRSVMEAEVEAYASALREHGTYIPYKHSWAHWTKRKTHRRIDA